MRLSGKKKERIAWKMAVSEPFQTLFISQAEEDCLLSEYERCEDKEIHPHI
jgi:hypothetical protein